jgi:hypothetical protein
MGGSTMSTYTEYSLAIDTRNLEPAELAQLRAAIAEAERDHEVSAKEGPVAVENGGPVTEDSGVTFLIITGVVVGIGIILRALPLGQIIDLRTDPPKTRIGWGLNSKLMLVIGTDGEVEIKTNETSDVLDDALKLVLELFKAPIKTVDDIAQAVKDALKDKVEVIPARDDL